MNPATEDDADDTFPLIGESTRLLADAADAADAGRVGVYWHVLRRDLEQLRTAFPARAGPVAVIRLFRLTGSGSRRREDKLIARTPLSDTALLRDGRVWFDVTADGVPVRAELGLEAADGGWLLLVRSDAVVPLGSLDSTPVDPFSGEWDVGDPEPALAATGADLEPVFPEVEIAAVRPAPDTPAVSSPSSPSSPSATIAPAAGESVGSARPNHGAVATSVDVEADATAVSAKPERVPDPGGADQVRQVTGAFSNQPASALLREDVAPNAGQQRSSSDGVIEPRHGAGGDEAEVYTELLVHGRARPGSEINLFGHAIRVGSGGRFALRLPVTHSELLKQALDQGLPLALPDGDES